MQQFRQGDVLIEEVDQIPSGAKPKAREVNGRLILAYGEQTGHHHAVLEPETDVQALIDGIATYLRVEGGKKATVVHEEHNPTVVEPGSEPKNYRVSIQKEYSPEEPRPRYD